MRQDVVARETQQSVAPRCVTILQIRRGQAKSGDGRPLYSICRPRTLSSSCRRRIQDRNGQDSTPPVGLIGIARGSAAAMIFARRRRLAEIPLLSVRSLRFVRRDFAHAIASATILADDFELSAAHPGFRHAS